jgi:regulator of protease activity HflC (stomatin/prohibitin superfamily)
MAKPLTWKTRPIPDGDLQSDETITEQEGYIPAKLQVDRLIMAGKDLIRYRKELFDLEWQKDLDPNDVDVVKVRDRDYDLSDAFQDSLFVKMKVREEKLKRKHAYEKAKKQFEEGLVDTPPVEPDLKPYKDKGEEPPSE